jgi:hypothetical protein
MKVLFSALHHAYFRNFESVIRALAARGHQVHLAADEVEAPVSMGGRELAERLSAELPGVTWDLMPPLEEEPWFDAARKLRLGLDYVRVLEPRYAGAPKLRLRTHDRAPRLVRWAAAVPAIGQPLTAAALKRAERLMPRSERLEQYLRRQQPDVVVLTSLTYSRSQQLDVLKAARALKVPVAAAIMSWDHLSSKALVHLAPDMVLVWNDTQRQEAVELHGVPADRLVITGAQCYDQWFNRAPERGRADFCRAMGLRDDKPFALWVHSALSPTPEPPEPVLVERWIEALRNSSDPRLRDLGVLVRPHPERAKEWVGIDLSRFENVAFYGSNPIDQRSKSDYYDALHHSSAVIGLVTSAFLEAAIVGRPVFTFTLPEYRVHQEEMAHFRYLTQIGGGLLRTAPDIETHFGQLAEVVGAPVERDERNRRFLSAFVRPAGLDVPATPAFADALERLHREGTKSDPSLEQHAWLRPVVASAARAAATDAGRWLMQDIREDVWDEQRSRKREIVTAKQSAKVERQRAKEQRKASRQRRERVMRGGKRVKSALMTCRYYVATVAHRALALAGLERGRGPT